MQHLATGPHCSRVPEEIRPSIPVGDVVMVWRHVASVGKRRIHWGAWGYVFRLLALYKGEYSSGEVIHVPHIFAF